jgi:hypothetical protein
MDEEAALEQPKAMPLPVRPKEVRIVCALICCICASICFAFDALIGEFCANVSGWHLRI